MEQITLASFSSKLSLQIVPHVPFIFTSTRPWFGTPLLFTSRIITKIRVKIFTSLLKVQKQKQKTTQPHSKYYNRGVRFYRYTGFFSTFGVVRTGTFFTVPVLFGTFRDQLLYATVQAINVNCHETKSLQELV